jgi:uncharacterized protein YfaS (alpha-2-macroglobulin family)
MWRFENDNDGKWITSASTKTTNDSGLAVFEAKDFAKARSEHAQYLAMVSSGDKQTFAQAWSNWYEPGREPWKIYAFTDRPAYRPGDTVQWKIMTRTWTANGYTTPADQGIEYEIVSPRGEKLTDGSITLNAFGSAWGSVDVPDTTALGEYRIQFWKDKNRNEWIGQAELFRLEEYKLPEFKVTITTPRQDGQRKSFRLGEYVQADISAQYYFGGPGSGATVDVLGHQNPC